MPGSRERKKNSPSYPAVRVAGDSRFEGQLVVLSLSAKLSFKHEFEQPRIRIFAGINVVFAIYN